MMLSRETAELNLHHARAQLGCDLGFAGSSGLAALTEAHPTTNNR
jgi:hypothetical protein